MEAAAGGLARLLRIGSGDGLKDLTTNARRLWMAAASDGVRRIIAALPVACLATALREGEARGRERLHLAAAQWMEKHIRDFRRGYELADLDMNKPVDNSRYFE